MKYIKQQFKAVTGYANRLYIQYYWWIKTVVIALYIFCGIITFWELIKIFN